MSEHYHDDIDSDTEHAFIHVSGRRFSANPDTKVYIPRSDNEEQSKSDKIQVMFQAHFGDTVLAPLIPNPQKILDCGTGSGIWAVDLAKRFPSAQVIGMDKSSVQKKDTPANCEFMVGDVNTNLAQFDDGTFDFVHSRILMTGITKEQWPHYMAEIFRILKPGGWAQCTESSLPLWDEGGIPEDSNYVKYRKMMESVIERNQYLIGGDHLNQHFVEHGFIDVEVIGKVVDIGNWRQPQEPQLVKGREAAMSVYSEQITDLGMPLAEDFPDIEKRKEFTEIVKKEFMTSNYPTYVKLLTVIGRKASQIPL